MWNFVKKHYKQFILVLMILILTYSFYLKPIISIDTENFINDKTGLLLSWIGINRFSLVFLKNIIFLPFNILITRILTLILFYLSIISYCYLFTKWAKKDNKFSIYIISLVVGLSPILAEQFGFTLQSLEISLGFFLLCTSFIMIDKYINFSKKGLIIPIVLLLSFIFGLYQAFVPLFISISCFYLLTHKKGLKKLIIIFVISLLFYSIIGFLVKNYIYHYNSNYLSSNFNWFNKSIIKNLLVIGYIGLSTLFTFSYYHLFSYLIIFIIGSIILLKKKKELILFFILAISPFLLTILTASTVAYRAQFNYIFALTLMITYLISNISNKKLINFIYILSMLVIIREGCMTFVLFYNDNQRYIKDVEIANYIKDNIPENNCLDIIGSFDNGLKIKGETLGNSFYNWDNDGPIGSNIRVNGFLASLNYHYSLPSLEYYNKYKNANIEKIRNIEGCYVVNLNAMKKD